MNVKGNILHVGKYIVTDDSGFGVSVHTTYDAAKERCRREGDQVTKIAADPSENELLFTFNR
jgi:hypothetical protein